MDFRCYIHFCISATISVIIIIIVHYNPRASMSVKERPLCVSAFVVPFSRHTFQCTECASSLSSYARASDANSNGVEEVLPTNQLSVTFKQQKACLNLKSHIVIMLIVGKMISSISSKGLYFYIRVRVRVE